MTKTLDTPNPLTAMANWVAKTPVEWPQEAWDQARAMLLDTVAVIIPGAKEPVTEKLIGLYGGTTLGDAQVIGDTRTASPSVAALINGTAAHALDFDDNFDPAKAHASAVLVPAILAAGDMLDSEGAALLDALIVGLQITGLVGQGVNPYHRSRGWHATGTVATLGAAASAARLMQLSPTQAQHALSLATSMAGGFMSQFGTMAKPLHAGLAAEGGVKAALLARAGLTAGDRTLDGPTGMGTLMVGPDVAELREGLIGKAEHGQTLTFATENVGEPLHIIHHGVKVKRFPNCGSVHRALDGLLALREQHGFTADSVDRIHVRAPAAHLRNLMYENPTTDMEAKFSLEYNLAAGLLRGTVGLQEFLPPALGDADIRAEMHKISKDYVDMLESEFDTEIHVTLKDGNTVSTQVHMPVGSKINPLSEAQLIEKLRACVAGHLDILATNNLLTILTNIKTEGGARRLTKAMNVGFQ